METKERELKGLVNAIEGFDLKRDLGITEDYEGEENFLDRELIFKPLWKWLLLQGN